MRALQWLAQREHSRQELRDKLLRLARAPAQADAGAEAHADGEPAKAAAPEPEPEAEVDALLDWLTTRKYLDEHRFVESRVAARSARYGNLRITQELRQHGASLDTATQQSLRESEYARARDVWQRKYCGQPGGDAARVKQMRFLAGRGFSAEVVRRVVRGGGNGGDED